MILKRIVSLVGAVLLIASASFATDVLSSDPVSHQRKPFLGKWKASDGKEFVEFLPGGKCVKGFQNAGHWKTTKSKFEIYYEGMSAKCGEGGGMFSREGSDKLIEDYGMGGDPITYYRTKPRAR